MHVLLDTRSHITCFIPVQKPLNQASWQAVWAGGHTSKQLHSGFLLGVSSQGPPREPSVGPTHHTPSPSHPQISACRRAAHSEETQSARPCPPCPPSPGSTRGAPVCGSPHLRSVLSAREMAGFLTALLQAALLLWERRESQCLPPGRKRRLPQQVLPNKVIKPDVMHLDCTRAHRTQQAKTRALNQTAKVGIVALMLPSHAPLDTQFLHAVVSSSAKWGWSQQLHH